MEKKRNINNERSLGMWKLKSVWRLMAMIAVGCCMLTACSDKDDPEVSPEPSVPSEVKNYNERMFPVTDPNGETLGTVMLRFYDDMPSVAYVGISDFYRMMYPGRPLTVTQGAPGYYQLASYCGTATVDTANDVFESDDYEAFTNLMGQVQAGMPNTIYDALPVIRWKSLEAVPQRVHVKLDYGKYGIDLRTDNKDVFFPFATIADLFVDGFMHVASFNGQTVMVSPEGAYPLDDGYPEQFITPILNDSRKPDMADFAYRNLCFTLTNFFGYPGRSLLENSMKEKGLDQALQDYGEGGQMTRELLKSENMYDFIAGTATLSCLLDDGGHTNTDVTGISQFDGNPVFQAKADEIKRAKQQELVGYCPEYIDMLRYLQERHTYKEDLTDLRTAKMGDGVKYYKEGSTVYCWFNAFLCNDLAWHKFYKGEGPKPTIENSPDDWLVTLIDALEKAEKDPEVKNFVLDISTNGGGSTDIVLFITSLLCNKSDIYYENVLTGQQMKCSYEVDRNLDGKFDEKDAEVKYNLNFALLTSPFCWSCANLLPALLKDYGVPIIGKQTSGGSCCVIYNPSADGFGYIYSSHRCRLKNAKGESIENGIMPDFELDKNDFFNVQKVEQIVESYYSK